ncbi:hypothetical protein G9A89_015107 [Geosiphon pyriformis]|nr:hypothetical protein G9A89_015107 [Geosiphon pyriformis]
MHGRAPANIIDEALVAREEVTRRNANCQGLSAHYHFNLKKIRKNDRIFRNPYGTVSMSLHNPSMLNTHRHNPSPLLDNDKRALWSFHIEKKRHINRVIFRMRRKVIHLQSEKLVRFFPANPTLLSFPPFEVSDMLNRKTRRIKRKTFLKMVCWVHYHFRQRQITKAELGFPVIRTKLTHPRLVVIAATSKGSEDPKCTTAGIVDCDR